MGVVQKLSDQLGQVSGNWKLQQDIMAGRGSPEDSRKGIIMCGNGHYRRQSGHLLWNTGRRRKCGEKGPEARAVRLKRREERASVWEKN